MAATITNDFKRFILRKIFADFSDNTNRFYIGIGKADQWDDADNPPTYTGTIAEMRRAKAAMQSVKAAADVSFVVKRNNWSSGTKYDAWDDALIGEGTNPFYVITDENNVYLCMRESRSADGTHNNSTVKPTHITATRPETMSDGYKWKYMFSLRPADTSAFLSANFIPVRKSGGAESGLGAQQDAVQAASTRGQITGVQLYDGGAGYGSAPTVTIEGDGDSASATAFVTGGVVTHIHIDSSTDSGMKFGYGYNYAGIKLTGGSPTRAARARAVIGDVYGEGIGNDPRNDLKSTALMFNTKPNGTESGAFFTDGQDFRQVSLMTDIIDSSGGDLTASAYKAIQFIDTDNAVEAGGFALDTVITGQTSGSKALFVANSGTKIYFTQNDSTGFGSFDSENISGTASGGGTQNATLIDGIKRYEAVFPPGDSDKGHILYIDNRAAVVRDNAQTEDLKVVIQI